LEVKAVSLTKEGYGMKTSIAVMLIFILINIDLYASDDKIINMQGNNMQKLLEKINTLPKELQEEKEKILNTRKKYIKLSLSRVKNLGSTTSKVGGFPYIPISESYPLDKEGKYMEFLAQINFSEMPNLENYPKSGLLQFFISFKDWGFTDYDHPINNDIKIIFRENLSEKSHFDYTFLTTIRNKENSPIGHNEFSMTFTNNMEELAPSRNYKSYKNVNGEFQHYLNFDEYGEKRGFELESAYWKEFSSFGHKIGGYADFAQQDPRFFEYQDYSELLFQLDSDSSADILWGDNGIANFFIRKEDLKNKNFSNVLYNWDSH
jgi:uncharacterized protein YwqG